MTSPRAAHAVTQVCQIGGADVAQFDPLQVGPDPLIRVQVWVQVWRVAGEPLQVQAVGRPRAEELLDGPTMMDRRAGGETGRGFLRVRSCLSFSSDVDAWLRQWIALTLRQVHHVLQRRLPSLGSLRIRAPLGDGHVVGRFPLRGDHQIGPVFLAPLQHNAVLQGCLLSGMLSPRSPWLASRANSSEDASSCSHHAVFVRLA